MKSIFEEKYPLSWKNFAKRYVVYSVLFLVMMLIFSDDVYISSYLTTNIGFFLGAFIFGGLISSIIGLFVYIGKMIFGNASSFVFYVERSYLFLIIAYFIVEIFDTFIIPG